MRAAAVGPAPLQAPLEGACASNLPGSWARCSGLRGTHREQIKHSRSAPLAGQRAERRRSAAQQLLQPVWIRGGVVIGVLKHAGYIVHDVVILLLAKAFQQRDHSLSSGHGAARDGRRSEHIQRKCCGTGGARGGRLNAARCAPTAARLAPNAFKGSLKGRRGPPPLLKLRGQGARQAPCKWASSLLLPWCALLQRGSFLQSQRDSSDLDLAHAPERCGRRLASESPCLQLR